MAVNKLRLSKIGACKIMRPSLLFLGHVTTRVLIVPINQKADALAQFKDLLITLATNTAHCVRRIE